MFQKLKIKYLTNIQDFVQKYAMSAVIYAETLLGKGFGPEKKKLAIDFLLSKLPLCFLPFRPIMEKSLQLLLDVAIEKAVKKLHQIQNKTPETLSL